ncbi:MAG: acyl-CoA transferase [Alphaproteobacteria bacterium]|nr:acyl-CoA transferase [Alphaproteobacteria bacterium]
MTTVREQALAGLFIWLKDHMPDATVLRNDPLPTKVPAGGLFILRDGDPGEPEVTLSPPRYHYQHSAEIEVLIQKADQAERDQGLDALLQALGHALEDDGTLGGLVGFMHIDTPEFMSETVEGAPTIKAAVVPVILEYSTLNPLK